VNIAFKTTNTIKNIIRSQNLTYITVVESINCNVEHIFVNIQVKQAEPTTLDIQDMWNNRGNTGFSQHILDTGHSYGSMENTMTVLKTGNKGQYMNSLEKYHIQKNHKPKS
jgi:hypothetical protein